MTAAAPEQGLSTAEATRRFQAVGPNELPNARPRQVLGIAWDVIREPMFLLLVGAGGVYLALGDLQEALLLLGSISVVIGITFYQERKTERALEALRDLSSPRALVIRDGGRVRVLGREVVPGDLVVLSEGDRIPADAVLRESHDLLVDESLLTGESVAVRKLPRSACADASELVRPGGDDLPYVYSGTLVVQGQGLAEVLRTGVSSELGQIGRALREVTPERTQLQVDANRLARGFAVIGLSVCAVVVLVYGATRGNWLDGILVGITLAMSLLPEEIPVVLTVFLALGAWRLSGQHVLTRRIPAIEALGAATVLCVDKTGTLTQNQMSVARLQVAADTVVLTGETAPPLSSPFTQLVRTAVLASESDAFDPMERAILTLGEQVLPASALGGLTLVHEYPLTPDRPAMVHVWGDGATSASQIALKGAPETVARLCRLDAAATAACLRDVDALARDGLRVLAVAVGGSARPPWPQDPAELSFGWLGLVGLADPLRPSVPTALEECRRAGIRVVMITGDFPVTARAIAAEAGLATGPAILTGPEVEAMDDAELLRRVTETNIYARVVPRQKLRLVEALKRQGAVVAMTGDGVNDAPALRAAHIGVAMGGRGTDVAREAAALVLLNDDFSSIVRAVRLGRRIFDNLRKAMAYIFAVHVPIAGVALVPVLLQWPLILTPVHVVFLELIVDPACSVVFEAEPEEPDVMDRPPRDPARPVFDRELIGFSVLHGLGVLLAILAVFGTARSFGVGEAAARALAFSALVAGNLGLIFASRPSWRSWQQRGANRSLNVVAAGAAAFLVACLYLPPLQDIFRFAAPNPLWLVGAVAAGLGSALLPRPIGRFMRGS